jgi:hypothetical protein
MIPFLFSEKLDGQEGTAHRVLVSHASPPAVVRFFQPDARIGVNAHLLSPAMLEDGLLLAGDGEAT